MPKRRPPDDTQPEPTLPEPEPTEPAAEPDPAEPTHDELYAEATELKIKGRATMSPHDLKRAVEAAREGQLEVEDNEPEAAAPDPAMQVTQTEARKIMQATHQSLLDVAKDPNLPPHLKAFIDTEVMRRDQLAGVKLTRESLKGHIDRFVVTKGGRYVTRDGQITQLEAGSLVTPNTHDLAHVQSQGIEYQACGAPEVAWDELGRPYTKLPGAPVLPPKPAEPDWLHAQNEERK
jgi:hypothetical protein